MDFETLGLFGVFLAGAIPWFEAIAVIPAGILFGLDPFATVIAAVFGNAITIFLFAYLGANIRERIVNRRITKGKPGESPKFEKALKAFDRYGIYGMALLGPILIGTQFAATASVAAGVKPLKASLFISVGMALWATGIAIAMVLAGLSVQ
jgi:hypothetical protein